MMPMIKALGPQYKLEEWPGSTSTLSIAEGILAGSVLKKRHHASHRGERQHSSLVGAGLRMVSDPISSGAIGPCTLYFDVMERGRRARREYAKSYEHSGETESRRCLSIMQLLSSREYSGKVSTANLEQILASGVVSVYVPRARSYQYNGEAQRFAGRCLDQIVDLVMGYRQPARRASLETGHRSKSERATVAERMRRIIHTCVHTYVHPYRTYIDVECVELGSSHVVRKVRVCSKSKWGRRPSKNTTSSCP